MGNENNKNSQEGYITFENLRKYIGITDIISFKKYLHEVFIDLSARNESNNKKFFSLVMFYDYMKLPIFIAEKLFNSFDKDKDGFLSENEFINSLSKLYMGTFKETSEIIFNLLDFDKDGVITKEDVKIILSYLPLNSENLKDFSEIQERSLEEIDEIINVTFNKYGGRLKFNQFIDVVMNKKSDIYLQLICFLYQQKPFRKENINIIKQNEKRKLSLDIDEFVGLGPKTSNDKDDIHIKIAIPKRKSTLSPAEKFLNSNVFVSNLDLNNPQKKRSSIDLISIKNNDDMIRLHNGLESNNKHMENLDIKEIIKNSRNNYVSPSKFLEEKQLINLNLRNFNLTYQRQLKTINEEKGEEESNVNDNTSGSSNSSNNLNNHVMYKNWVYKIPPNKAIRKFYLVLIDKEIYYYKDETENEFLGMHNLSGCFINENVEQVTEHNGIKYYSFEIIFNNKSKIRTFYSPSPEIIRELVNHIKKGIGYLKFSDYYEIKNNLGKGKFGIVKLGIHKKTGEKVAIKIMKKSSIKTPEDNELVRSEIDIMKLCHHPNIVRLLDHFENTEYIFIVMEYIEGGTLNEYLKKKHYNFSENQAGNLMFQIANGLKYLHKYGIVHRDLKPDNIMMTEQSEKGILKIMDFGLSKIVGPNDTLHEGYGTLSYVAPEVLLRTPYNKEIDMWSMGIILYQMLCGKLPFTGNKEEIIAKKIVFEPLEFDEDLWELRSRKVIDLIKKCLEKEPEERITIDEFIKHPWFTKNKKQKLSL